MDWRAKLLSIYPRLLVSFLIVIVPICMISLKMNQYGESNVRKEIKDSLQSRVTFYNHLLDSEFSRIVSMQEEYVNDRNLRLLSIAGPVLSDIERHEAIVTIHDELDRMVHTSPYISEAEIYLPASDRKISSTSTIFEAMPEQQYEALRSVSDRYDNPFVFWRGRLFVSFPYSATAIMGGQEPSFVISVEIDVKQLKDALAGFAIGGSGGSMIVDPDERWSITGDVRSLPQPAIGAVTAALPAETAATTQEEWIGGRKYWLAAERSPNMGVTLVSYLPESDILGSLIQYRIWYWVLAGLSILMIALFAYWIFLQIHQPMQRLMRAFQKVEHGNWKLALMHGRKDEFGYLYSQFNSMVAKINELVHQVYEQQYRANLSELRQLQSQINPHFLYNSFFNLYRMAKNEENDNIARFSQYLGRYFQFITRTNKGLIPLREEVEFSQIYVDIQSFRFEDRIVARFDPLPEAEKELQVPKLVLQPVIENVYQHGLRDTVEGGSLRVRFERDGGCLIICVEDNGAEMPDAEYEELHRKLQATERIDVETTGLVNVHRRLRLAFGDRAGVSFNRRPGGGNQVLLAIPAARQFPLLSPTRAIKPKS